MIWSNTAFTIYMGDALGQEPESALDRDVMNAEAPRDRDVMLTNAARVHAREDVAQDAAMDPCRPTTLVARGARG